MFRMIKVGTKTEPLGTPALILQNYDNNRYPSVRQKAGNPAALFGRNAIRK